MRIDKLDRSEAISFLEGKVAYWQKRLDHEKKKERMRREIVGLQQAMEVLGFTSFYITQRKKEHRRIIRLKTFRNSSIKRMERLMPHPPKTAL